MRLFGKVDGNIDHYDRPHFWGEAFDRPFYHEFPTLSRAPSLDQGPEQLIDTTLRSPYVNGDVMTRAQSTILKQQWDRTWRYLTAADKAALKTLQDNVKVGGDTFRWTNTEDDIVHTVRLEGSMIFHTEPRLPGYWKVQMVLTEA